MTKTSWGTLTAEEEAALQQAQQAACGRTQNSGNTTKRTTGRRHGGRTVETHTTRWVFKRAWCADARCCCAADGGPVCGRPPVLSHACCAEQVIAVPKIVLCAPGAATGELVFVEQTVDIPVPDGGWRLHLREGLQGFSQNGVQLLVIVSVVIFKVFAKDRVQQRSLGAWLTSSFLFLRPCDHAATSSCSPGIDYSEGAAASVLRRRGVPQSQFIDGVRVPVVNRDRYPRANVETVEIPQLQSLDSWLGCSALTRWSMCLFCRGSLLTQWLARHWIHVLVIPGAFLALPTFSS